MPNRILATYNWVIGLLLGGSLTSLIGTVTHTELLAMLGVASTLGGAAAGGAIWFYQRAARARLEVWKEWDAARANSFTDEYEAVQEDLRIASVLAERNVAQIEKQNRLIQELIATNVEQSKLIAHLTGKLGRVAQAQKELPGQVVHAIAISAGSSSSDSIGAEPKSPTP